MWINRRWKILERIRELINAGAEIDTLDPRVIAFAKKLNSGDHGGLSNEDIQAIDLLMRLAYREGKVQGIWDYAIHKDGQLLVDCMQIPLKQVLKEIKMKDPIPSPHWYLQK